MNRPFLIIAFCCAAVGLHAQSITFDMPKNAGVQMTVFLKQGIRNDTLFNGKLDEKGQLRLSLPEDYRGIAAIRPERIGAYYEFVAGGEDMILHCDNEYPYTGVVRFENSPENDSLDLWYARQAVCRQKTGLLSELRKVYEPDDALYPLLAGEQAVLQATQSAFVEELSASKLYAARFLEHHYFLNDRVAVLAYADSLQMASIRRYLTDSLDVESLYTSGLWFNVLNGSLALYGSDAPFHADFVKDMSCLLRRAGDKVYGVLAENLVEICEAQGWHDQEVELAFFLQNNGRIGQPTGKLAKLYSLFKVRKGMKAPALTQLELPAGKTLLVFYETGCGACENEMQQLKANYPLLKERGYEVVSISADADERIFRNTAAQFPWTGKHCDLKGFDGADFKNYGVIGTPTFYVIDEKGMVRGRYARLADTGVL